MPPSSYNSGIMVCDTLATARALKEAGLEMKVELYKVAIAIVVANAAITFCLLRFFNP